MPRIPVESDSCSSRVLESLNVAMSSFEKGASHVDLPIWLTTPEEESISLETVLVEADILYAMKPSEILFFLANILCLIVRFKRFESVVNIYGTVMFLLTDAPNRSEYREIATLEQKSILISTMRVVQKAAFGSEQEEDIVALAASLF